MRWFASRFGYKTHPQCGATISSTDAILDLVRRHPFEPANVDRIDIDMASEGPFNLVGSAFALGENPQVSGQFNVRYCVANAIVRNGSRLDHFTNEAVSDPRVGDLARRIHTRLAPALMEGRPELGAPRGIDGQAKGRSDPDRAARMHPRASARTPRPKRSISPISTSRSRMARGRSIPHVSNESSL